MKRKRKNEEDRPRPVAPGRVEPAWIDRRQALHDAGQLLRDVGAAILVVLALALLGLIALSGALRAWRSVPEQDGPAGLSHLLAQRSRLLCGQRTGLAPRPAAARAKDRYHGAAVERLASRPEESTGDGQFSSGFKGQQLSDLDRLVEIRRQRGAVKPDQAACRLRVAAQRIGQGRVSAGCRVILQETVGFPVLEHKNLDRTLPISSWIEGRLRLLKRRMQNLQPFLGCGGEHRVSPLCVPERPHCKAGEPSRSPK